MRSCVVYVGAEAQALCEIITKCVLIVPCLVSVPKMCCYCRCSCCCSCCSCWLLLIVALMIIFALRIAVLQSSKTDDNQQQQQTHSVSLPTRVVAETKTFRNDVLKLRGGELSKRSGNEFTDSTRKNIRKASDLTESQIRKLKKG
jgi:hypothetical protein